MVREDRGCVLARRSNQKKKWQLRNGSSGDAIILFIFYIIFLFAETLMRFVTHHNISWTSSLKCLSGWSWLACIHYDATACTVHMMEPKEYFTAYMHVWVFIFITWSFNEIFGARQNNKVVCDDVMVSICVYVCLKCHKYNYSTYMNIIIRGDIILYNNS